MSKDSNKAAKNLRASGAELLTLGIALPYQLASAGMPASGLGAGSLTAGAPLVIEARRGGGGPHVNRNIHVNRNLHVNRNIHVKGKNIQGGKKVHAKGKNIHVSKNVHVKGKNWYVRHWNHRPRNDHWRDGHRRGASSASRRSLLVLDQSS
jgi:hypothetical protein